MERDGRKGCGDSRRHQPLVQLEKREIDGQHRLRPRLDLALEHVAMEIDKAWQDCETASDQIRVGSSSFYDLGDSSVFYPQSPSLDHAIGKYQLAIADPHRMRV